MKHRQGSAYLMVMGALIIASFAASLLLRSLRQRQFRISVHRKRMAVQQAADASLVHAFHRLKGVDFSTACLQDDLTGRKLGEVAYDCVLHVNAENRSILLEGHASWGTYKATMKGLAQYKSKDRAYRWSLRYLP